MAALGQRIDARVHPDPEGTAGKDVNRALLPFAGGVLLVSWATTVDSSRHETCHGMINKAG
jgi:hypothetical protein